MSNYVLEKQCANCFSRHEETVNLCNNCGELMIKKISKYDEEYKQRYKTVAEARTKEIYKKFKESLDISDLQKEVF